MYKKNQCMPLPNQLNIPWFLLDHVKEVFILLGSEKTGNVVFWQDNFKRTISVHFVKEAVRPDKLLEIGNQ